MIESDPSGAEIGAVLELADLAGRRVLEIGSGDGRLTWRYARSAAQVTALEPFGPAFERAVATRPGELRDRVRLVHSGFMDFVSESPAPKFDVAILPWAL
jgi:16S rRNA A1518/A1519 N6-dimethyltransferase RsmA/KsgA/DIM1 with predicted DNA glycosylase/AP lyase activity